MGLLLAAFFNLESELYYELFSNYMGKGDKESFAHAMQAVKQPFALVPHQVGSIGETRRNCHGSGSCGCASLSHTQAGVEKSMLSPRHREQSYQSRHSKITNVSTFSKALPTG